MDWKYIRSLNFENLTDEEKDDIYTTVTWYDFEDDDIDLKRCKAIFKVSQEILKYKGEQVETLFHELEEITVKQVEDEARKEESETEVRSVRSKKSSMMEFENLERKYIDLKGKYKKVVRNNEKNENEIEKLNKMMKNIQQENRRLQNEIQSMPNEIGSESDISETIRDQQRELVETINNKNKQISELLKDIEEVENENFILRDKLARVRDELSLATKEITSITETLEAKETTFKENIEKLSSLEADLVQIKQAKCEIQNQKDEIERKFQEFSEKVTKDIDELKNICGSKDLEIKHLKSRLREPSVNSSIPSLPNDENDSLTHIGALQKALSDREKQLGDVKIQLQVATKEMEMSTEVIKILKQENDDGKMKMKEMEATMKELKKQLKIVHERCQILQSDISFNEKTIGEKEAELREFVQNLKHNGKDDLAMQFEKNHDLKTDNRLKEKQIISLVKTTNKLQDTCELLDKENYVLREKLGISEEEQINLSTYNSKEKRRRKELEHMKTKLSKLEEQNIDLKSEVHKLNQMNYSLSNQLIDLGEKPSYIYTTNNSIPEKAFDKDKQFLAEENKNLVEENEALRKGMHDILDSINNRKTKSSNEIKSETLDKLLRALDVKHISGWYHPAMRLQAEVHNIEGINSELREQLRKTKIELAKYRSIDDTTIEAEHTGEENADVLMKKPIDFNDSDVGDMKGIQHTDEETKTWLENLLESSTGNTLEEMRIVVKQLIQKKEDLEKQLTDREQNFKAMEDSFEILGEKLRVLTESETDEEKLKKIDELITENVSMKRKVVFMETDTAYLRKAIDKLNSDLSKAETNHIRKLGELERSNKTLANNLIVLKKLNELSVSEDVYNELENNFDNMTINYRELGVMLKKQQDYKDLEIKMLQESQQALELDKEELKSKVVTISTKLILQTVQTVDENLENLAKKLSQSEVNEMTERQRANHTNNLYELVKEQLSKSEERFQEYSKYNEDLLKKNLVLQEQLKEAEEKIVEYVDKKLYKQMELENNRLLEKKDELEITISKLEEDNRVERRNILKENSWNDLKEQELLNLKHQIVDLISLSDENVIITQLNNDVFQYRQSLNYYRTKLKEVNEEMESLQVSFEENRKKWEQENVMVVGREEIFREKNKNLKNLLNKQKIQYLGCIPLWSEETYLNKLKMLNEEKHNAFLKLHDAQLIENEAALMKEQLQIEMNLMKQQKELLSKGEKDDAKAIMNWMQEKKTLKINELRYKRQSEFKEKQLEHFMERIKIQDDQISQLDEALLLWQKNFDAIISPQDTSFLQAPLMVSTPSSPITKMNFKSVSIQTVDNEVVPETTAPTVSLSSIPEFVAAKEALTDKQNTINEMKNKISDLEMTVSMFRAQIGDKQSQISFYEKHILELQNKKTTEVHTNGAGGDNINIGLVETASNTEEILALKTTTKLLQDTMRAKEDEIIKYQTLLKVDRDKHSLAAANLQEELKKLQKQLLDEKQRNLNLEESHVQSKPTRAAIDQYVGQVHALEKHTSELHTKVSSLEAQLQSSRQEAVRWRSLANDRLTAMEELRRSLEDQHKNELMIYKSDSEKLKELSNDEMNSLNQLLVKQRVRCTGKIDIDVQKLVTEKDEKINELTTKLRQMKMLDLKKHSSSDIDLSPKLVDLEASMDMLSRENEILKKRCEQLLSKEKNAKDEIRDLKAQLLRKPSSIRNDKVDKNIKDQLQKKVTSLENEIESLKSALTEQISINETHKVQASEDFDKWKKTKHWQQTAEKLKNRLKEKEAEFDKLQQTSVGYRLLIERLEREKYNLENRIKTLKTANAIPDSARELEILKIENMKLLEDLKNLNSRLELQQHHSGALGAAMMQEKLESQERKIAILELSAKGTSEIRSEMDRLQVAVSTYQKNNLLLETENLDLKLDLEKAIKDQPQLHQRIQQLESYIEILNAEHPKENITSKTSPVDSTDTKKVEELERTVFIMKRVVEKLQTENKKLLSGKRPISERVASAEKNKKELICLKKQYSESLRKIKQLELELSSSKTQSKNAPILKKPEEEKFNLLSHELTKVKEELSVKSIFLDKVKVLLQRAAAKEKSLLQEISELKNQKDGNISPIVEETETSSDV